MEWLNWCPEPSNERRLLSSLLSSSSSSSTSTSMHYVVVRWLIYSSSHHRHSLDEDKSDMSFTEPMRSVTPRNNIVLFYHQRDIRLAPEHCAEEAWQLLYEPNRTGHTHNMMRIIGILQIGITIRTERRKSSFIQRDNIYWELRWSGKYNASLSNYLGRINCINFWNEIQDAWTHFHVICLQTP